MDTAVIYISANACFSIVLEENTVVALEMLIVTDR